MLRINTLSVCCCLDIQAAFPKLGKHEAELRLSLRQLAQDTVNLRLQPRHLSRGLDSVVNIY